MDVKNNTTVQALAAALKFREMRQEIIASNIANAETPGYKAKRLDFEGALQRAIDVDGNLGMKSSDSRHFDVGNGGFNNLEPRVYEDPSGVVTPDGNTVNREQEMVRMQENRLMYDAAVQLLNKKLGQMKYVLSSEKN
jgi:flagellar basal-body rod protein FlgB